MKVTGWPGKAATVVILAAVGALALGGCTGRGTPAPGNSTPSSASSPSAAAAPATTTPPAPAAPVTNSYDAARVEWQGGAAASSADQGRFWSNAVADLTRGETTDTDQTGYAAAITMLNELISLPDAQQTPAQNAAYHSDLTALNGFFKTPGLYS
jgi:hypothetical protein